VAAQDNIARIQSCIRNRLDEEAIGAKRLVAVIGDSPSRYSKSPSLWNAAFRAFKIDAAVYVALDVDDDQLPALMAAVKESDRVLGLQVTVPHKVAVMNHLDALDENAARIGAVNTIVRAENGRLAGANTDGEGFVESLLTAQSPGARPFMESLGAIDALILGAGGSARAVAFAMAEKIGSGHLLIANRTYESARSLAADIGTSYGNARAIRDEEIAAHAPRADLIVNCTTKGQGGIRKTAAGATILEPYSALAPAHPAGLPEHEQETAAAYRDWRDASSADIEANNEASWKIALSVPPAAGFYDLVYHPAETVFLRHARQSGHRTLNGQGMIVGQAAEAFFNHICRPLLERENLHTAETKRRLVEIMRRAW
jgi:shikimate dehydrogenase